MGVVHGVTKWSEQRRKCLKMEKLIPAWTLIVAVCVIVASASSSAEEQSLEEKMFVEQLPRAGRGPQWWNAKMFKDNNPRFTSLDSVCLSCRRKRSAEPYKLGSSSGGICAHCDLQGDCQRNAEYVRVKGGSRAVTRKSGPESSDENCQKRCRRTDECFYWSYNHSTRRCNLIGGTAFSFGIDVRDGNYDYTSGSVICNCPSGATYGDKKCIGAGRRRSQSSSYGYDCGNHGENYLWCYTDNNKNWDYCRKCWWPLN